MLPDIYDTWLMPVSQCSSLAKNSDILGWNNQTEQNINCFGTLNILIPICEKFSKNM